MSKEEVLLEVVLDNFSNILEVLNATKDIENFLVKLKLNKKRGVGVILEKTKNLVDSLYNHSIKVKDEFYKHYNMLDTIPSEKEKSNDDNSTIENNIVDNTNGLNISEEEGTKENSEKTADTNQTTSENNIAEDDISNDIANKQKDILEIASEENEMVNNRSDSVENNMDDNNDTIMEKTNDLHEGSTEDPLKDVQVPDCNDANQLLDNDKENVDSEKNGSLVDEDRNCENTEENIERKALIRLVDLSKLIDPKPKKTVKFDSSVIILTSSDEEGKSPNKNTKEQNGILKSMLVNSKSDKTDDDRISKHKKKGIKDNDGRESHKNYKYNRSTRNKRNDQSSESSSDVEVLGDLLKKNETTKDKKIESTRNLPNSNESSDSDVVEVCSENISKSGNKKTKTQQSSKNVDTSSDSVDSDEKSVRKRKKRKEKSKINDSDSDKNSDVSDSDCDENKSKSKNIGNNDSNNSRRSRRISTKKDIKERTREKLKTIFKRKSSRSGKSNFEIISDKSKDNEENSSDSASESTKKRKKIQRKKDILEKKLTLSSSTEDETEDLKINKNHKKKENKSNIHVSSGTPSIDDIKFTYKVYIPLPRIECSQLKEIYLTNKEILEIKRLTNLESLRKSKRSRATKNVSSSSSDTEKPRRKRSKKKSKNSSSSDHEQTSADENCDKLTEDAVEKIIDKETQNEDQIMADIVMDELKQSEVDVDKPADDSSDSEKEKKQTSKKNNKKVNDEENSKKETTTSCQKEAEKSKDSDDDENEKEESKDKDSNTDEKKKDSKDKDTSDDENEKDSDKDKEPTDDKTEKEDKDKSSNDEENSDNSDEEKRKRKKKWRKDKLLTTKIDSTDSEDELNKYRKKKENSKEESRKTKKRVKKVLISDSDSDSGKKKDKGGTSDDNSSDEEKSSSSNESESKEVQKKKPTRSRIKRTKDSSSDDDDKSTRKQIRRVIGKDALSDSTKQAEAEEKERKARIAEKQKKYNSIFEIKADSKVKKVVLDIDEDTKEELLTVNKKIVKKLKPHQASGVQFMWDACFESLKRAQTTKGSGCILAHCMGLGKTLQVIALTHCLLTNSDKTLVNKVMVVCPINTVLNWKAEFKQWLPKEDEFEVYELVSCKQNYERQYIVQEWHNDGGVLIVGYQMFRNLSNPDNRRLSKKMRASFKEGLVDPGPDLVVCDEGHLLKNEKTHLSIAMNRIKTARRIVLTGTPLQNNLKEYWCMVQFIKPNLLGTYKEYLNRFVNPIINGQYTDSTQHDILLMRKRSHVLHKLLDGVVQRRDYSVLEPYLPPKHEYVLFVQLTEVQVKLYEYYMEKLARKSDGSNRTSFLFTDFQQLQRICTHPRVLLDKSNERKEKFDDEEEESEGSLKDFIDDGDESSSDASSTSSSSKSSDKSDDSSSKKKKSKSQKRVRITRSLAAQKRENNEESEPEVEEIRKKEWWQEFCDGEELDNINNSGKLFLLFQILKECEEIGDKVLVFSQSLYTLNCIEYFLEKIDESTQNGNSEKVGGHTGSWSIGLDYFRLDGSSSCDNRATWCDMFNSPDNIRARLFLISTKAGGLGINLVAANRVIIFDVSWNPSHDIQSIYRVYRFGQTKPCYIYRFVTYGTMEMKIYERQVTKQAISKRVIDEQQIDRHYNQNDLQELYKCDLQPTERPIPLVPKDVLLGEMLQKYDKTIYKYHLHQSLLENKEAEGLNEEERKAAWEEFENEKVLRKTTFNTGVSNNSVMNAQAIEAALTNIVRKDNPTWSEVQVKGIIPALVQQLRVQLSEGDMTMYTRVQQEMQIMQAQAQKLKEAYFQQQVMRMIQHQQEQAKMLGNMNIDPVQLARAQANMFGNLVGPRQGSSSSQPQRPVSNDVIELND